MNELGAMVDREHGVSTNESNITAWNETVESDLNMTIEKDSSVEMDDGIGSNSIDMVDHSTNANDKSAEEDVDTNDSSGDGIRTIHSTSDAVLNLWSNNSDDAD